MKLIFGILIVTTILKIFTHAGLDGSVVVGGHFHNSPHYEMSCKFVKGWGQQGTNFSQKRLMVTPIQAPVSIQ